MDAKQIYENFVNGRGGGPLASAAQAVDDAAAEYRTHATAIRRLVVQTESMWKGEASGAAQRGAGPLVVEHEVAAPELAVVGQSSLRQVEAFDQAKNSVMPVPDPPVAPSTWDNITSFGGASADYEQQLRAYQAAVANNIKVMQTYIAASTANSEAMPTAYGNGLPPQPGDAATGPAAAGPGGAGPAGGPGGAPQVSAPSGGGPAATQPGGPAGGPSKPSAASAPSGGGGSTSPSGGGSRTGGSGVDSPSIPVPPGGSRGPGSGVDPLRPGRSTGGSPVPAGAYPVPGLTNRNQSVSARPGRHSGVGGAAIPGPALAPFGAGDRVRGAAGRGVGTAHPPLGPGALTGGVPQDPRNGSRGFAGAGAGHGASAAARSSFAGGGMPFGAGMGRTDDEEHERRTYMLDSDPNELFGVPDDTVPPVIGE